MTDKLPPLSTQIATPSQTVPPVSTASPPQDATHKVETVEEEPYTIKCICNFSDDDGNTIYCETCDTWQHIECFYPNNVQDAYREDFSHSCADCKPRPLDRQAAMERQRAKLSTALVEETPEKRPKRPPSKSHKKKPKPADLPLNGSSASTDGGGGTKHGNPPDQAPPPKKSKTSHKANPSISSQAAKRSPSYGSIRGQPQGHPPSPATTPPDLPTDFEIHNYSPGFLSLYDEQDVQNVQTNSFASLMISNAMSLWLREPDKMRQETGQEYKDVFQPLPPNIDALKRPLHVEHKKLPLSQSTTLHWQYLTTPSSIEKDVPLMELNGQIGFQNSYCADPDNRWDELTSPLPFVFFHPMLPLYIDTRKEGSRARYVRRSCKPNAVLDTFLSSGSEYHFWLVSDRPIAAGEQITLPWDFRFPKKDKARMLRLLGLGDDEVGGNDEPDVDPSEYHSIASWVHLILSEYGGCACDLGSECAFARFHRNYFGKAQTRLHPPKKKRKPKTHTLSPTSTGHATNSRAASEGRLDDAQDHDGSVSGSSRSKPPSRDMTPARQGSFDMLGILTEPTDRDKRKVAMIEDSFRKIEQQQQQQQQQQQPPRKKKRVSDGSGTSGTSKSKSRNSTSHASTHPPNGLVERAYVDAGTSQSKSGSPASALSPKAADGFRRPASASRHTSMPAASRQTSVAPRSSYCDAGVQTDPVDGEWYSEAGPAPKPRRRIVSLSKRLLENRHRHRLDEEEQRKKHAAALAQGLSASPMDVDSVSAGHRSLVGSPILDKQASLPPAGSPGSPDVSMSDAPAASASAAKLPDIVALKLKSPDLRVQMPPVPTFGGVATSASIATIPLSATGSMAHSPFAMSNLPSPFGPPSVNGVAATPSPVKKKLSLSDYTKSRMNKASRPPLGTTTLRPTADEPKSAASTDAPSVESPTVDQGADALAPPEANASSLPLGTLPNGTV